MELTQKVAEKAEKEAMLAEVPVRLSTLQKQLPKLEQEALTQAELKR